MREIKYASIGKAVLIRMVGLQENYKDDQKLDRKKSGCFSCPHFGDSLKDHNCAACTACQKKVFFSPYINEQNRFGYQAPQSLCAMKLFLYLHFCSVTKSGAIEDISISSLAKRLNISQRNIHYCLKKLANDGYIVYGHNEEGPGHYSVFLTGYDDYFKEANVGGRGYIVFSAECFNELFQVESVNQMRLYLRMYINIDNRKTLPVSTETFLTDSRSAKEISRYFPAYFKQGKVIKLLEVNTPLFSFYETDGKIQYTLNKNYYGDLQKKEYYGYCLDSITSYIQDIGDNLKEYMDYKAPVRILPDALIRQAIKARSSGSTLFIGMNDNEAEDLASLATQYSYDEVKTKLDFLWANNSLSSLKGHYGEYIRCLLENRLYAA